MMRASLVSPALGNRYFVASPVAESENLLIEGAHDLVTIDIGVGVPSLSVIADIDDEALAELIRFSPSEHTYLQELVAPIEIDSDGSGVLVNEETMEFHRPYPYQVGGIWFVAVRHHDDRRVAFYQLT